MIEHVWRVCFHIPDEDKRDTIQLFKTKFGAMRFMLFVAKEFAKERNCKYRRDFARREIFIVDKKYFQCGSLPGVLIYIEKVPCFESFSKLREVYNKQGA